MLGRARKVFAGYDREACGVLPDDDMKKVWADVNRDLSLSIRVEEPRGELITLGKFEEQLARELERS